MFKYLQHFVGNASSSKTARIEELLEQVNYLKSTTIT